MKTLNKIFMFILSVALLSTVIGIDKVNAETGTEENMQEVPEGYTPIYDIADLYAIRNNPTGNYILMNDIDMTEDTNEGGDWEQGNGWEAIETFSGVLDGNGYRIIGMHIFGEFAEGKCAGLVGKTDHAEICNLGIKDCNIDVTCNSNKSYYIGGIVGEALAGTIVKNCYVTGTMKIQGDSNNCGVGGLIGKAYVSSYYDENSTNILIENSYNTCNIDCSEATAGGFAGGIIGYADAWYGNWKVNEYINYHGCIGIENVYNVGTITGNEWCVTQKDGTPTTGALCGYYSMRENGFGGCIKSYYLKGSSQQGIGNQADSKKFGSLTEVQMKTIPYFTGFDFINTWEIDPYCSYSYPQLKNNRLIRVASVKLRTQPVKIVYNQGDKLDLSGSAIEVCFEDDIKTTIPVSAEMISGYDMNKIGTQTVTVTYCGVKTSFDIEIKEIPVSSVTIPKTVSIYRSKTYQMVADILPANASNKSVTWESEDANVVSVDENGLLKAKAKGKAKIIVTTANGLTQECEVTVLVASAVVTLNQTEVTLKRGESATLIAQITPLESTDTITWESNNTKIAEVIEGVVVAKSEGVATISAYTESGVKATCRVTVEGDTVNNNTVGTTVTVDASKCKVKVLSNATTPTVEYVATTDKNATSVRIPNTVTVDNVTYEVVSIATGAFRNNKKITKVTIGSNITTIGSSAFSGCSKLKTVSMGANVTTINAKAFYKCIALTKITVPVKVSKIGKQAFYGCKKLKSITIKTTKLTSKKVGSKAFKGIYSKATIKVPKKKLSSYKKILKAQGVGSKVKIKK